MVKPSTGARCPLLARKEPCWVTYHCKWWANSFLHLVVKGENDMRLYLDQWRWTDYEKDECDVMDVAWFTEQLSAWTFRSTEFHWNNFQDMFSFLSLSFWLLWKSGYTRHGPGHERILVPALISRSFWSPTCDPRSAILFSTMFAFLYSTSERSKKKMVLVADVSFQDVSSWFMFRYTVEFTRSSAIWFCWCIALIEMLHAWTPHTTESLESRDVDQQRLAGRMWELLK